MIAAADGASSAGRGARSLGGALALALLVEAAIVAGVIVWLRDRPAPAPVARPSMELSLVTLPPAPPPPVPLPPEPPPPEPPPPEPPPPQPAPPPPVPAPPPELAPPPKPLPQPKPPPKPLPQRPKHVPEIVAPAEPPRVADTPAVQYPPAPAPPQPPAPAASPAVMASFESQVRAAVEAAVEFPFAAQTLHQYGRARVEFDYLDGAVSGLHLVQSSGFPLLDPAALAAVRTAHYPPPPREAEGRVLHYLVWVRFEPGASR